MMHEEFGQLVQELRLERTDVVGGMTQERLALDTGLSVVTIRKIEAGTLSKLTSTILLSLANALGLSTMERREFFLAATDTGATGIAAPSTDPQQVVEELTDLLAYLQAPAYLLDCYGDVIVADQSMLHLFDIDQDIVEGTSSIARHNIMRFLFDPKLNMKQTFGAFYDTTARYTMQFFREITLRYRATPYFKKILSALKEYPDFKRYWYSVRSDSEDNYGQVDLPSYQHPKLGKLEYMITTSTSVTSYGELHMITYIPLARRTKKIFDELNGNSTGVWKLASWPSKNIAHQQKDRTMPYPERSSRSKHTVMETSHGFDYHAENGLTVRRILDPADPDVAGMLDLLHRTIPDNEVEPDEEIRRYMQENLTQLSDPERTFEEYFIVAKQDDLIVGYIYFTYYLKQKLLFINYLGADTLALKGATSAAEALFDGLQRLYIRRFKNAKGILYEIDRPDAAANIREEKRRKARRRLFSMHVRSLGYTDYVLPIDYVQPILSINEGEEYTEEPLWLLYVPLDTSSTSHALTKDEMASLIETTYYAWYGDIYDTDPQAQERYLAYLDGLVDSYVRGLPDLIALHD